MGPLRTVAQGILWIAPTVLLALFVGRIAIDDGFGARDVGIDEPVGSGFPRTIVLPGNDPIWIRTRPRRIVLANTSVVDMATALVEPERIAALCEQAFEWSHLAFREHDYASHPTFRTFLTETVLAHDGDLVLCTPFNIPETLTALRELGIAIVCFQDPTTLDDVRANLRTMARVLGAEERLATLERDLDECIATLERTASPRRGLRALFYSNFGGSGYASGARTLSHEAIRLAGMIDAGVEAGLVGTRPFSFEELIALDPDVLIVSRKTADETTSTETTLRGAKALAGLRVLGNDGIVALPPALHTTTSQEIVHAAEEIARQVDQSKVSRRAQARGDGR
ncbi:MAG: ABC transporter substrate-binding protein [Planctomycetes bacterium]|nr:ABC transporter substrate-binding protein [Planctomycetota bacterium]